MKFIKKLFILALILAVAGLGGYILFKDRLANIVVEKILEYVLLTDVDIASTHIDTHSKDMEMSGLVIHNTEGYTTPSALEVGTIAVDVDADTWDDEVKRIKRVELSDLLVTIEQDGEQMNLKVLSDNAARLDEEEEGGDSEGGAGETATAPKAFDEESSVQIDLLTITGIEVQIAAPFLEQPIRFPLPDINMENLGGTEGASVSMAIEETLNRLTAEGMKSRLKQFPSAFQDALQKVESGQDDDSAGGTEDAIKKIGGALLKRVQKKDEDQ